ncbi:di-heme-cytochrome C peroxidase [Methylocystis sp. JAN1]|uniref:di-heme-cytochrome C peroxidase n=1 Tax=Methylocystis sp. JAN1 TaxID=3397211 RepID=UPI003FA2BCE8
MLESNRFISSSLVSLAAASLISLASTVPSAAEVRYANQGDKWTPANRLDFYTRDQGARIIPFAWFKALKRPDGSGFLDDSMARYGYLPNPDSPTPGLPVGFLTATENGVRTLSMTCSACHTRQIEAQGVSWRIDGGPALTDFQSLLADIDKSVDSVLHNDAAFDAFAKALNVNGDEGRKELRQDVEAWFKPYHAIMSGSLVTPGWGVGRADAVSMIFNRVAGLDIGEPPNRIIQKNIAHADAPVRYPFVWNAPIQDTTQWPGFAKNGDDILGLARNVGEVYGVFGVYRPTKTFLPNVVNFLNDSSLNYAGLQQLEILLKQIAPPKWPFALNAELVRKGDEIFHRDPRNGGCAKGCHEIKAGAARVCNPSTWLTPIQDVGTDSKEYSVLGREADTGVLEGASIAFLPGVNQPLEKTDKIISILGLSVIGSILEAPLHFGLDVFQPIVDDCLPVKPARPEALRSAVVAKLSQALKSVYRKPEQAPAFAYESRVMNGVWAAAPYLHNGSVPTLEDLLKPAAERPASFKVGPAYDIEKVGLAKDQPGLSSTYTADDCSNRSSGNSRCGHEFGTKLTPEEKRALLEYLKSL